MDGGDYFAVIDVYNVDTVELHFVRAAHNDILARAECHVFDDLI